jgi:signal transduction histidine kinase
MTALPAMPTDGTMTALSGRSLAIQRRSVLTILTLAGALCTIALWWFETSTGLIADHDQYGYPFLLGLFGFGLLSWKAAPQYRTHVELICYVGVALYFIVALFSFVILQSDSNIYTIANTLQWMPLVYIAAFVFFNKTQALVAGAGVFLASLVPPLAITVLKGAGFWSATVAALLLNAYVIHLLTLMALSLVVLLHEQLEHAKQALLERDEALAGLKWEADERLRLEEQLRRSQRMEAVGQLTGGIAHDFNNLLTVVIGNAEALIEEPSDPEQTSNLSKTILAAAERGADLTQKLLAFGRRQSLRPERLVLADVVDRTLPLLRRTLGEHIDLRVDAQSGIAGALADRTLLESAILNLTLNARDAMPHGGTLTIRTGQRTAGPDEGEIPVGQDVVFLSVSDTGAGMPPDVLAKAFEPFFTTKEIGKGSGLGLSMVYGFAKQSGGHVSIASKEGQGTTATILLRAVGPVLEATPQGGAHPSAPPLGVERVLLVEDEPQVLQFASSQLVGLGYEVTAVSSGVDALDLLAKGLPVDLLFTDVVLPKGISGVELARRAKDLKPNLKVLLTSGYSEDAFAHHGRPEEGTRLLRKPYRRQDLARALREVLTEEV